MDAERKRQKADANVQGKLNPLDDPEGQQDPDGAGRPELIGQLGEEANPEV